MPGTKCCTRIVSFTPAVTGTVIASILQMRTLGFEELLEMAQSQAVVFVCLFVF